MLPAGSRLRRRSDFSATLRQSRATRAGGLLIVHARHGEPDVEVPAPVKVGFVVSRAVGPAVTRNRVRRRLRHLVAARLPELPLGTTLVIRALPGSATAHFDQLDAALGAAMARALPTGSTSTGSPGRPASAVSR